MEKTITKEMANALRVLAKTCKGTNCSDCMLSDSRDDCILKGSDPEHFEIREAVPTEKVFLLEVD